MLIWRHSFYSFSCFAKQDLDSTLINISNDIIQLKNDFESLADYKHIWGQEVEAPKIIIENINVNKDNLALMKGTTMKIIPSGQPEIDLIKFKVSEQEYENLYSEAGCVTINVLGVCERNTWNNKPQLIIKSYEIVDRQDYYF